MNAKLAIQKRPLCLKLSFQTVFVSGFSKYGIYPNNSDQVLSLLPSEVDPEEANQSNMSA